MDRLQTFKNLYEKSVLVLAELEGQAAHERLQNATSEFRTAIASAKQVIADIEAEVAAVQEATK